MLPASLSVAGLKRRVDKQLSGDDTLLEEYLEGAFQQAQAPPPLGCGRLLAPDPVPVPDSEDPTTDTSTPVTRTIRVTGRRVLVPDARMLHEVKVDGVAVSDYDAMTRDGLIVRIELAHEHDRWHHRLHRYRRHRSVELVGRFGFAEIPAELREAIYILAARTYYEREAQFADQVALAEGGSMQAYYRQLPPRARLAFQTFALPDGMAGLS